MYVIALDTVTETGTTVQEHNKDVIALDTVTETGTTVQEHNKDVIALDTVTETGTMVQEHNKDEMLSNGKGDDAHDAAETDAARRRAPKDLRWPS